MYETFEHTADLGLRVRAPDMETLFAEAGAALSSIIVDDLATVLPQERREVKLSADEPAYLLFDWLRNLLYCFDAEHMLFSRFEVHIDADGLVGSAWGEPLDRARHMLGHEVKAITYHGLRVEKAGSAWLAEVIVDI
jgi:SHS2 domain-containing protein